MPSFTEGSPKVILESLSRLRPVIVFREIKHVKSKFKGVFITNRNTKDLKKTIIYILKNYKKIQLEMKNNKIQIDYIVPVYNEEKNISKAITNLNKVMNALFIIISDVGILSNSCISLSEDSVNPDNKHIFSTG